MPKKYRIHSKQTPPLYPLIPRFSAIEYDGCLGCMECVKRESCLYEAYSKSSFFPEEYTETGEGKCVMCMRCVQECKKNILTRAVNPRFALMGNRYWTPELIDRIWRQTTTGTVPVSGAGYRGPFSGPGFDQMWTDMSEIVRPTRDGIHGREYISTSVELGRKPDHLEFDAAGRMLTLMSTQYDLPLPVIFDATTPLRGGNVPKILALAAEKAGVLAIVAAAAAAEGPDELKGNLIVHCDPARDDLAQLAGAAMAELSWSDRALDEMSRVKEMHPGLIVSIRLPLDEHAPERVAMLARSGAEVIRLQADLSGRGFGARADKFITLLIREVHLRLVADGVRNQVSLLASGGIALAEHVAKIIICGADAAVMDYALWIALECRLCADCTGQPDCPVQIEETPVAHGVQRIVNFMGAIHSQIIEVMGAMGLREARRLRGEVGRAMFFDDLERECFAPLFGERASIACADMGSESGTDLPSEADWAKRDFNGIDVRQAPSRYRNLFGRHKVVRSVACETCGRCAAVCEFGVHVRGGPRMLAPRSHLCRGAEYCRERDAYCVDHCPKGALRVGPDPLWETIGDKRWTADLLAATWLQAETGRPPDNGLEYRVGASEGGFDRIYIQFPEEPAASGFAPGDVELSIPLNRTGDGRPQVTIGFPIYGGGMSFGSISLTTMLSRAQAYTNLDSFTCSGEGGYPEDLGKYEDHVITQVATGLFGVREETIQRSRIIEFKYAQGAKPGLGGHLLGDKVTPAVAKLREAVEGSSLFSPFPFHSVYSVEDHKKHVDWIKHTNPRALVSVKVSTPTDVEMVAVGSYYAGAHIIHIDGSYGGTGAAPDIAKKNIAMPIEYAIPRVHRFLTQEGIRDKVTLIASGGIRTAWDIAKAIALGADGVVIGTAEMVALECIRCANCESGRGCPRGIATTDPELSLAYDLAWGSQRLTNLFHSFAIQVQDILWRLGMQSVRELVGRNDLLAHLDYETHETQLTRHEEEKKVVGVGNAC
jgi:glutamate synthase domain-containing protein 2/ferredoxin